MRHSPADDRAVPIQPQDSALSGDAVATLVDAAQPADAASDPGVRPAGRRGGRVRTVDFSRPAKFTGDQERRLARLLDTFCRTASTRLAAELRMPVELEVAGLNQLTWANAHGALAPGSICATVEARPIGTRLLLAAELPLVLSAIERLLGAPDAGTVRERKLTDIDWVVARLFFTRVLVQLSAVFSDAAGLELELATVEGHLDTEQMAPVSEPTLAATIAVRHDATASTMVLLVPWAAIAPVADTFAGAAHGPTSGQAAGLHSLVAGVDVVVQAEVAAVDLAVETILAIRPGDVIGLGRPSSAGVSLTVGGVPVCRAAPGRVGPRRAVQVIGP